MSENLHTIVHHVDFFPLRIRVFRNGDMFDQGRILVVTRKQFKHWIVFLDALTALLRTATAVRRLYTIQGIPIHHFDELETNGEYVAVESGPFLAVPYGQTRFTLRGKRYNPIIRVPKMVPTFLNSAESMDIYLKKEGYGTITGLPYPFDGILSRSPSASNIQIKHLQSHVPPLKIGGSMEHLNELGPASWLGKNEKWMMGERVKVEAPTEKCKDVPHPETKEAGGSSASEKEASKHVTKLPRLLNSNRSFRREAPTAPKVSAASEEVRAISENLPPIDLKGISANGQLEVKQKKENDTISIKTEEEVISIVKPEKATTESIVSSKVSRKPPAPTDDEVRYHRSYQVTETTYVTTERASGEQEKEEKDGEEMKETAKVEGAGGEDRRKTEKKERAKWADGLKRSKSVEKKKETTTTKKKESVAKTTEENKKAETDGTVDQKERRRKEAREDVDMNEIPIRFETGAGSNKIVTSRSSMHLFVDEYVGEDELDDVIERAQLWDHNRRRQKMRQQCTQTSATLRSISAPRRRVQLFDPDFD